jgi:ABC-type glycerol-3-phosphate transport system substrate-binding protein
LSKRLIVLFAGALAIAMVAAGCGSSSSDSTDATVTLTKVEFVNQGDAICKKGSEQIEDEANAFAKENNIDTSKPTKAEQEEVIAGVLGPALQKQADEISALGAPDGEEEKVEAVIEALESGAEELEDDPASLLEENGSGPLDRANKLANEFGFKECGQE